MFQEGTMTKHIARVTPFPYFVTVYTQNPDNTAFSSKILAPKFEVCLGYDLKKLCI